MPPGTLGGSSRRGGTLGGSLSGARVRPGQRPGDLNERGFLSRFASDIGSLATNFPRAMLNIVGAPISDVAALAPGGREAGSFGQATGGLALDIGESLGKTALDLPASLSTLMTGGATTPLTKVNSTLTGGLYDLLGWEQGREIVEERQEFRVRHPGIAAVEDLGNVAIGGAVVSKPLALGARSAAGASAKGLSRTQRAAQLADIEAGTGPGAGLARASRVSGDVVARPYRASGRALADMKLPNVGALRRGEGLKRNASPREVLGELRDTVPTSRRVWTADMVDAAELRRLRGEVEHLNALGDQAPSEALQGATTALANFEQTHADRLPDLEQTQLAPTPLDELASPLARDVRSMLDTEGVQRLTEPLARASRETRGLVQELREKRTDAAFDTMAARDPKARRTLARRQLRDLDMALREDGGLAAYGIELPTLVQSKGRNVEPAQLYDALETVRTNPELRAQLPRLDGQLELTLLDLYEQANDLPDGALRNQLYDDATLTPEVADTLRRLQREGGLPDDLPDGLRAAVEDALGQSYRIPDDQLANPISAHPQIADAYQGALVQLTREAADRDVTLATYGLGDPERWALRAVNEDGAFRPMAPDENPSLLASPSRDQARQLKRQGARVGGARRNLEDLELTAANRNVSGRSTAAQDYRVALREQRTAAIAWNQARRTGDEVKAAQLRTKLDEARTRAEQSRAESRADIYTGTQRATRTLESLVREMAKPDAPIGAVAGMGADLLNVRNQLEAGLAAADLPVPAKVADALDALNEAGVDLASVDATALDNLLRHGEILDTDMPIWMDALDRAREAIKGSKATRSNVRNVERLLRSEARARVELKNLRGLERRLDSVEGRLTEVNPEAVTDARARLDAAVEHADQVAESAGVSTPKGARTPGRQRHVEDRLLKEETRARLQQAEVNRAAKRLETLEQKFDEVEAAMRDSLDAAPAVARPVLQVGRAMHDLDQAFREAGLTELADDLGLTQVPALLEKMETEGVSPTFLRRMEERAAGQGYRAAAEQPVQTPTMSAQRRREMTDIDLRRDIDRVKIETDLELAGRVMAGEMIDTFEGKFGRSMDQIAEGLFEQADVQLNREAWRSMSKHQREKLLQEQGYVQYAPESLFSFKVRRTNPEGVWVPAFLQDALTQYAKQGSIERFLSSVVAPATTTWKHFVLALRPAWQVYNAVGNMAMATFAGGVPATAYLDFMRPGGEARKMLREHRLGWDLSARGLTPELSSELFSTGLSQDLAPKQRVRAKLSDALTKPEAASRFIDSGVGRGTGRMREGFGQAVNASYRVNSFLDNLNRASVYLYDTLQGGMSPEDAVRHANRTLGEYTKMTPTEKLYVRSVFPFYAWMRHITRLSTDMLKPDSITRAATLGSVVSTLGEPNGVEEFFPEYMAGDIAIGDTGKTFGMRGFNPWQDVLDPFVYNGKLSLRGAARSMHPLIQFGLERNSGTETLTGRPFSRPTPILDDLGRDVPTPPGLLAHARQKFAPPQFNLGLDLFRSATGQTTARYDTGEPMLFEGVQDRGVMPGIGSFLGAPIRDTDAEGIQERRAEAMDRAARQIARYREEVADYEEQRGARTLSQRLMPFGQ